MTIDNSSSRLRSSKVHPWHLDRLAVVYVRQSSPQQVIENRESTERHMLWSTGRLNWVGHETACSLLTTTRKKCWHIGMAARIPTTARGSQSRSHRFDPRY
jgi:hypothetical protein